MRKIYPYFMFLMSTLLVVATLTISIEWTNHKIIAVSIPITLGYAAAIASYLNLKYNKI